MGRSAPNLRPSWGPGNWEKEEALQRAPICRPWGSKVGKTVPSEAAGVSTPSALTLYCSLDQFCGAKRVPGETEAGRSEVWVSRFQITALSLCCVSPDPSMRPSHPGVLGGSEAQRAETGTGTCPHLGHSHGSWTGAAWPPVLRGTRCNIFKVPVSAGTGPWPPPPMVPWLSFKMAGAGGTHRASSVAGHSLCHCPPHHPDWCPVPSTSPGQLPNGHHGWGQLPSDPLGRAVEGPKPSATQAPGPKDGPHYPSHWPLPCRQRPPAAKDTLCHSVRPCVCP